MRYGPSTLCYGLGIYEARTKVILSRLFDKLSVPENALDPSNAKQWEEYLLLALLSRNLRNVSAAIPLVSSQSETLRLGLRQSVASEHILHEMRRWSPRTLAVLHTSLALIEACTGYTQAFLRALFPTVGVRLPGRESDPKRKAVLLAPGLRRGIAL